jgi:hypothetical protein
MGLTPAYSHVWPPSEYILNNNIDFVYKLSQILEM